MTMIFPPRIAPKLPLGRLALNGPREHKLLQEHIVGGPLIAYHSPFHARPRVRARLSIMERDRLGPETATCKATSLCRT
jgi:hypothetical protein